MALLTDPLPTSFSKFLNCTDTGRTLPLLPVAARSWGLELGCPNKSNIAIGESANVTLPALQQTFVDFFFEFAWKFFRETWRGFLVKFFWSPFPTKRSTKTPKKIGENSEQNSGQKFEKFGKLSFCDFSELTNALTESPLVYPYPQKHAKLRPWSEPCPSSPCFFGFPWFILSKEIPCLNSRFLCIFYGFRGFGP